MSTGFPADRRQFGRRESNVRAMAVLPAQIMLPCVIKDISDGGALLCFTDGAAPIQSFRLLLEGTEFNLLCELRHSRSHLVGVRFVRLAEGIALNRYLNCEQVVDDTTPAQLAPPRPRWTTKATSIRQLREVVFPRQSDPAPIVELAPAMSETTPSGYPTDAIVIDQAAIAALAAVATFAAQSNAVAKSA